MSLDTLRQMFASAVVCLVMSSAPVGVEGFNAAASGEGFEPAIQIGVTSFDAFALTDAEAAFSRAAAFAPTPKERALAVLWLGAVRAENGDFTTARSRFADAVIFDIDVVVPAQMSPTISDMVQEARRSLQSSRAMSSSGAAPGHGLAPEPKMRWALLSGAAVTTVGVLAVGGGAMVGLQAITQRDVAASTRFQSEAVAQYQKAREGARWSNVLYGAGGVLFATGTCLAIASLVGADNP